MSSTKLLLIRHGETDDNHNRVFQGQGGCGLNARGRDQSARLAARLGHARIKLDVLYCSDLDRARETAEIIGRDVGLTPVADAALREVYLGAWQGLRDSEIAERFPDEWAAWQGGRDIKRGGGESYAELSTRVVGALDRLSSAHAGQVLGIVSHGASIKTFVAHVLGLGFDRLRSFQAAANTSVNLVERDSRGAYRLVVWNDAAHLHDPLAQALAAPP